MWDAIKRNIYWLICKCERYDLARERWVKEHNKK